MLWRGSLLPLDCVAVASFGGASHPSASKLARHNKLAPTEEQTALSLVQCDPRESRSGPACRVHQWLS
ncbi:hypothetical protein DL347_11670 [Pseudomonas fluorescens]|uniref:Uncharacterized protein n=1 Tax=Pseudomonas fluorescens TaxID=294 RepID=A0A7Z6MYT2_PSEFL|nr:hypothetical protein DL347_11670 [Pseudomonas fluorescens]